MNTPVSARGRNATTPLGSAGAQLPADSQRPWVDQALCVQVGGEPFYPEAGGSASEARMVCNSCPVREQCLQWAIDHEEKHGVWGGLTYRQRLKVARERERANLSETA